MKKNSKKIVALTIALGIIAAQSAYAAYSSYGTFSITNSGTSTTTAGTMLGGSKTTTAGDFTVFSNAKTMTSSPSVKLVNSNGETRSSFVSVPEINTTYTGSNNTGTQGYTYYAYVQPAWNQIGTDTITLKHDPK